MHTHFYFCCYTNQLLLQSSSWRRGGEPAEENTDTDGRASFLLTSASGIWLLTFMLICATFCYFFMAHNSKSFLKILHILCFILIEYLGFSLLSIMVLQSSQDYIILMRYNWLGDLFIASGTFLFLYDQGLCYHPLLVFNSLHYYSRVIDSSLYTEELLGIAICNLQKDIKITPQVYNTS